MRLRSIGPFLGLVTSLDPRHISENYASDLLNIEVENGVVALRRGYRNITAINTGYSVIRGFHYVQGYNSSGTLVEAYVSFDYHTVDTVVRPFWINPSTGARTSITTSALAVPDLAVADWRGVMGDGDTAYFWAVGGDGSYPFAKWTVGDADTWVAYAPPATPSTKIIAAYYKSRSGTYSYDRITWAGLVDGDVTKTGVAAACALTNGFWETTHTASTEGRATIKLDFALITAGDQDFQNNDVFRFNVYTPDSGFEIDWEGIEVKLYSTDVTGGVSLSVKVENPTGGSANSTKPRYVYAKFPPGKVRADWDVTEYIELSYQVTTSSGAANTNRLRVGEILVGGITDWGGSIKVGYSYYNSVTALESGVGGVITLPIQALKGGFTSREPGQGGGEAYGAPNGFELGTIPVLTVADPGAAADNTRLYIRDNKTWRRVATQADSDLTYTFTTSRTEFETLTEYTDAPFKSDNILAATRFKSWMVWLYEHEAGKPTVRHSRMSAVDAALDPYLLQASLNDKTVADELGPADEGRGADFALPENDEPVRAFACDDALIILGRRGVYAQVPMGGTVAPWNMAPPKAIPGAAGAYDYWSACVFRDDNDIPGVAYLSYDWKTLWYVQVSNAFDGDQGFRIVELSEAIRGQLADFLFQGNNPNSDVYKTSIFVNPRDDTLHVRNTFYGLKLGRPSLVDGKRQWTKQQFNRGSGDEAVNWQIFAPSDRWGIRGSRVNGKVDEFEYDSSSDFDPIEGDTRDGGFSVNSNTAYWESKYFVDANRRVDHVMVERSDYTETPTVTVTCSRQTSGVSKVLASGKRWTRFAPTTQGWEIKYKLVISNTGSASYYRMVCRERPCGTRLKA